MKTGIIIPCYNEENRLNVTAFIDFISKENNYHLCFVNDGSKDNTIKLLTKIQQAHPLKVSVIDLVKNGGKALAVRAGAKHLYTKNNVSYIGFMDADLSTDFKDFGDLVSTLRTHKNLEFVFGSRSKEVSDEIKKNRTRAAISKLINVLIVFILGMPIADTQCGAKVFNVNLVPLLFGKKFKTKWLFDVEMFIRLKRYFGKEKTVNIIYEQALSRWVHMEDSKLGLKDSIEIPFKLISIWVNYNILSIAFNTKTQTYPEPAMRIFEANEAVMVA